jgi:hypothetical protein
MGGKSSTRIEKVNRSRNQQHLLQLAVMSAPQSVQCFGKKKTGELRASHPYKVHH